MTTADRIKEHIVRHLKWDSSLKGSQIKVDYIGRTAILEGTVPNLQAHAMAQRDALSIPGVDRVDNRLTVKFSHEHPDKTDEEIRSAVRTVLECTVSGNGTQVDVSVIDGIVTLQGKADSYWKRARIEDLASSVEGILKVDNEIRVTPSDKPADSAIKKEIIDALGRMEVRGLDNIRVEVGNGIVTLTGSVPTWSTAFDVEDTARYTEGVVDVKSRLEVE